LLVQGGLLILELGSLDEVLAVDLGTVLQDLHVLLQGGRVLDLVDLVLDLLLDQRLDSVLASLGILQLTNRHFFDSLLINFGLLLRADLGFGQFFLYYFQPLDFLQGLIH